MHAISLDDTEFEGKNNAYLLDENGSLALIDTSVGRPGARTALSEYGYEFADIGTVVLTYWYPDHAGLAEEI